MLKKWEQQEKGVLWSFCMNKAAGPSEIDLELDQKLRIHGSVPPRPYTFRIIQSAQIKKNSIFT
jgi:hypothetical protein